MNRLNKENPCKPDCPDRCANPNCHATCKKHKKWKEDLEEEKKKIYEYNVKHGINNLRLFTSKTINIYQKYRTKRKDGF